MHHTDTAFVQVYTLEKVLQQKKDAITQSNFMDEAMKVWSAAQCLLDPPFNSLIIIRPLRTNLAPHSGLFWHGR